MGCQFLGFPLESRQYLVDTLQYGIEFLVGGFLIDFILTYIQQALLLQTPHEGGKVAMIYQDGITCHGYYHRSSSCA